MEALMTQNQLYASGQKISVTPQGEHWFRSFGIDFDDLRKNRRQLAYPCLDWSERKEHLAGALGAALAQRMLNLGWLVKNKHTRVILITDKGHQGLFKYFGITLNKPHKKNH